MPAEAPPRRITIHKVPYDFWHSRTACTCYKIAGEYLVPDRVAADAIASGYATAGWARGSVTRTRKGKSPAKPKTVKPKADAAPTNRGSKANLAGTGVAADGGADVQRAVAAVAGKR